MAIETPLGRILKPLNSEYGKATPGWGTTPIMGFLIGAFGVFLIILVQIANHSIVLTGVNDKFVGSDATNNKPYR